MRPLGHSPVLPPSADASRIAVMRDLWQAPGFEAVETRVIEVQRRFTDFENYWEAAATGSPSFRAALAKMDPATIARIKAATQASLPADAAGTVTCTARANAVKGRLPA
jgi:hypothetical protein